MKKYLLLILVFALILISGTVRATDNNYGADAQWKNLGNDSFEITFKLYRRCTSSFNIQTFLAAYPLILSSDSCANSYAITLDTAVSYTTTEVTPTCKTAASACNFPSAGVPYGILEYTMVYKVYLGGNYSNCCWYKLSWTNCCRPSNITTGYADKDFATEFWLNRCVKNNSPRFTSNLLAFKCAAQDVKYNLGMQDDEDDSLSYSLNTPYGGTYASPWSATYPLTCLGGNNPNPSTNPPTGFNLNPITGDLLFRPMQVQISVIKITIKEWRKVNGVIKLIGVTNRDMQIAITQNCNNKLPTITASVNYYFCSGSEHCFTISTSDVDLVDTTRLETKLLDVFKGAKLNIVQDTVKNGTATFCWTPDSSYVRTRPYYLQFRTYDSHCPLYGENYTTYAITVSQGVTATIKSEAINCTDFNFIASYDSYRPYREWKIFKGDTLIESALYQDSLMNYRFKSNGTYYVHFYTSNFSCTTENIDTIEITNAHPLKINRSNDTTLCLGNGLTLSATPIDGLAPYNYSWKLNNVLVSTSPTFVINPVTSSNYILKITSSDSCKRSVTDTVRIKVDTTTLKVDKLNDTIACSGIFFKITPRVVSGEAPISYSWYKNGALVSNAASFNAIVTGPTDFTLRMVSSNLCENIFEDTIHVDIDTSTLRVKPVKDTTICIGSSVTMTPAILTGKAPLVYQWFRNGALLSVSPTYTVSPTTNATYELFVYSSDKCSNTYSQSIQVDVINSGIIVIPERDTNICRGETIDIIPAITQGKPPFYYSWFKDGVLISNATSLSVMPQVTASYQLSILSSDLCFNTYKDTFNIHVDTSRIIVNPIKDSSVCRGSMLNIIPVIIGGKAPFQYEWYQNNILINIAPMISLIPASQSTYTLKLSSSDDCNNLFIDTFIVDVVPLKQLSLTAAATTINKGQSTVIKSNGKNNFNWIGNYIITNWGDSILVQPIISSDYKLICINNYGCIDTAQISINVSNVGIHNSVRNTNKFSISPNPAQQNLLLKLNKEIEEHDFVIYNVLGQVNISGLIASNETLIDISTLSNGVYFIRLGDEVCKFIKN